MPVRSILMAGCIALLPLTSLNASPFVDTSGTDQVRVALFQGEEAVVAQHGHAYIKARCESSPYGPKIVIVLGADSVWSVISDPTERNPGVELTPIGRVSPERGALPDGVGAVDDEGRSVQVISGSWYNLNGPTSHCAAYLHILRL